MRSILWQILEVSQPIDWYFSVWNPDLLVLTLQNVKVYLLQSLESKVKGYGDMRELFFNFILAATKEENPECSIKQIVLLKFQLLWCYCYGMLSSALWYKALKASK